MEFYVLCGAGEEGVFAVEPYGYSGAEDDSDLPQEYMRRGTLADLANEHVPYVYAKWEDGDTYCMYRDSRTFASESVGLKPEHSHLLRLGILRIE